MQHLENEIEGNEKWFQCLLPKVSLGQAFGSFVTLSFGLIFCIHFLDCTRWVADA